MDKFVYKSLFRHERQIQAMSQAITDLQEVVAKQGELIAAEQAQGDQIEAIVADQAEAIAALEAQIAALGPAGEALNAEVAKIKSHNEQIEGIVTTETGVNPTPPTDPNAPRPDNSLPGPQPGIDNTLPGDLKPKPEQLPAAKKA